MEARKTIDQYNAYRFFKFFFDINAANLEGLFYDVVYCLLEYFSSCNVLTLHIWCTEATMHVSCYHTF